MKKLSLLAFLFIGIMVNAQKSKMNHFEYFTASVAVDPNATIKEQSPNVVAEIEYVNNIFYIKASTQFLPELQGGYFDYGGGAGINIFLDRWKESRIYYGGRLGVIKRGGESYPLAGFEGGYDYLIIDNMFIYKVLILHSINDII